MGGRGATNRGPRGAQLLRMREKCAVVDGQRLTDASICPEELSALGVGPHGITCHPRRSSPLAEHAALEVRGEAIRGE